MKKLSFLSVLSTVLVLFISVKPAISGTNDPVLLKINEREVTLSDFEYVYTKNNLNPQVMDPKSVEEYMELFINFNLKVYEALQLQLDTSSAFKNELEGYRKQLAQPYLSDQDVSNHLLDEAFQRQQYDIRASHILISLDENALPEDTLVAWNKANDLRNRIMAGESFEDLAREYSEDPSAKGMAATPNRPAMRGNGGDLGYFSVLDMVYPFENAAFNLQVGEISTPVRSNFGYHVIKLTDKLPAMGRAKVAHIMVSFQPDADSSAQNQALQKITEIHQQLISGEEFASLAERFSDDKASGRRGGELPPFTANRMVPEFIKAIAGLNTENPYSSPVKTLYGWHIIKLIEKVLPPEEEAMAELKTRITRDTRSQISQKVVIDRLKNEYSFVKYPENIEPFFTWVNDTIFEARWEMPLLDDQENKILFSFADKTYTQRDFGTYIEESQVMRSPEDIRGYVISMYDSFEENSILAYEEKLLPEKYPEFRRIMNEYHDGILLFELTDRKVWGRAMEDTVGLKEFFNANIGDYMWSDRYNTEIFTFANEAAAKKGRKAIRKALRKNTDLNDLLNQLNADSQLNVSYEEGIFELDEYSFLSQLNKQTGVTTVIAHQENFVVLNVKEFLPAAPKNLSEIRGLVIADYQNFLEKKWINELREKYSYTLDEKALNDFIQRNE